MSASAHESEAGHHEEELGGFTDDPRSAYVVFAGVVGTLILIISIIVLQALVYQYETAEAQQKIVNQQWTERIRETGQQQANLHSYRWIDKEKGVVTIPIEDAMRIVAREEARAAGTRPRSN